MPRLVTKGGCLGGFPGVLVWREACPRASGWLTWPLGGLHSLRTFNVNFVSSCAHAHRHHLPKALGKSGCLSCFWQTSALGSVPFSHSLARWGGGSLTQSWEPAFPKIDLLSMELQESLRTGGRSSNDWMKGAHYLDRSLEANGSNSLVRLRGCTDSKALAHPASPWSPLLSQMMVGVWKSPFYRWGNWPKRLALNWFIQSTQVAKDQGPSRSETL